MEAIIFFSRDGVGREDDQSTRPFIYFRISKLVVGSKLESVLD